METNFPSISVELDERSYHYLKTLRNYVQCILLGRSTAGRKQAKWSSL